MRLHRLEIAAFGPFSGTEVIDFDALSDAGLFLVQGRTGAGKTSVLDAVCFALYGQVPGVRNAVKGLRSDHAPPGAGPRVVLELFPSCESIFGRELIACDHELYSNHYSSDALSFNISYRSCIAWW